MEISWLALLRAIHIIAAALWFGAAMFGLRVLGPAIKEAGPAAGPFMAAAQRNGRMSRYMGAAAGVAIVAGLALYGSLGYFEAPFATIASTVLTLGAVAALAAWILGMAVGLPLQRRLGSIMQSVGAGGPTPEQGAELGRLQQRMATNGRNVSMLIALAFVLMVGRGIVF